jgi:pSer/pThr/pTyr-binding forkhead associated (FHA) protein
MAKLKLIEYRLHKAMPLDQSLPAYDDPSAASGVKLIFKEKLIREYRINWGMSLSIGRSATNDIVIRDPTVSRKHAVVEYAEGRYLLTDLGSRNGTLVNKTSVTTHRLNQGDVLKIGKHHLIFTYDADELELLNAAEPAEEPPAVEATISLEPHEIVNASKEAIELVDLNADTVPPPDIPAEPVSALRFLAGGEGDVKLTKDLIKVGKDPSCDIVVGGVMMGKMAFTIGRRPTGFYLHFVGGACIPKVNGQHVRRSMRLVDGDIIDIKSTKLQFVEGERGEANFTGTDSSYHQLYER